MTETPNLLPVYEIDIDRIYRKQRGPRTTYGKAMARHIIGGGK